MCFLYASIVTKNLLPQRKLIINGLRVFFWINVFIMGIIGYDLNLKTSNNTGYARILCTDPSLLALRMGPFLSSIFFAIIIKKITNKVNDTPSYLQIEEARKYKRLKTLKRLRIINHLFIANSLFLIIWDIARLIQNYGLPPEQVNCFGMVQITIINDILWFMARFFAS